MKICSKCKINKDFCKFGKYAKSKDGLNYHCRECNRRKGREYARKKRANMTEYERKEHAQKCKEWRKNKIKENPNFYKAEYYRNHDRNLTQASEHYYRYHTENIEKMRNWRNSNLDKMKNAVKNWRKNNPEKLKEGHKKWMKENAAHVREYNRKRRAKKALVTIQSFTAEQLDKRMSVFGYKCVYCDGPFEHVDHVIPLSKGGPHCLSNLRPACQFCNLSKHAKKLSEWLGEVA
ncbi:MAG: HNH endonuclease [SAR86 cluster bacterium]|nr:HNH endonuclease [SAR86 cluster bacterium]